MSRAAPRSTIVAIGGSAGAFPIILHLARSLTSPGDATLFVIYHRAAGFDFHFQPFMPAGGFAAVAARNGIPPAPGTMYFPHAADDMEVHRGRLHVAPPRSRTRPNIDRLFVSLAAEYGPRVVAVLLSGYRDDGVAGLKAVRHAGGHTLVQDPLDAAVKDLPQNAASAGQADEILPAATILARLHAILVAPVPSPAPT